MNEKILSLIGLILGGITVIMAFVAGLEWDWGIIGLFAGAGLVVSNLNAAILAIKNNQNKK